MPRSGSGQNWRFLAAMKRGLKRREKRRGAAVALEALEDRMLLSIDGVVFNDFNNNGVRDLDNVVSNAGTGTVNQAVDDGVAGIVVTAYDSDENIAATTTTAADGSYSLPTDAGEYRLEFTVPSGFFDGQVGASSSGSVQFVSDGSTADLGIHRPEDFSQDNPTFYTSCYVFGDQVNGANQDRSVVVSFRHSAGTDHTDGSSANYQAGLHEFEIPASAVGTTWGLSFDEFSETLYMASFTKKHAGYGPSGNGAIYARDSAGNISTLTDLNTVFGANTAGVDFRAGYAVGDNPYVADSFDTGWDAVGKTSLGGAAVNRSGDTLYVMNLADRNLYAIPTSGAIDATTVRRQVIPVAPDATGVDAANPLGDLRPFAVTEYRGKIYVGMVNSAESTGASGDLKAYIYEVTDDGIDITFGAAPVFQMDLNYTRNQDLFGGALGNWRAWVPGFQNIGPAGVPVAIYPQPWLTDIEFDEHGNIGLGIVSRDMHQTGNNVPSNPATPGTGMFGYVDGETLRAFINTEGDLTSGYTLESNARGPNGEGVGPQDNNAGPDGGEFYFEDYFQGFHPELGTGGLANVPGFNQLLTSVIDPAFSVTPTSDGFLTSGISWYNNDTGEVVKAHQLTTNIPGAPPPLFGKAAGIGDVEGAYELSPMEIGNRLWFDTNADGIQTAGELNVPDGVTLQLYDVSVPGDPVLVGTTSTADGQYYFNSSNVAYADGEVGLKTATDYEVRMVASDFASGGLLERVVLTGANKAGSNDQNDSDAVYVSGIPVVAHTTGNVGETDHSLDIGLRPSDYGDLPDDYDTSLAENGPSHNIDGETFLGSGVDFELDGQASATATDDGSDENGITFNTPLIPGENASITVNASKDGYLNAWIDFNSNGSFDVGEQIATDVEINAGDNELIIAVPAGATGVMAARFRFTCDDPDGALGSTGAWDNGEVEDYMLGAIGDKVWLDNGAGGGIGGDGMRTGAEPGLGGVVVNLLNPDGTAVLDAEGDAVTATTDADGCYKFVGLPPGDYRVGFELPDGYQFTKQNFGPFDSLDSDADPADGRTDSYVIPAGVYNDTIDAGLQLQDFGDLPNGYGTGESAPAYAVHGLDGQTYLGTGVDAETDGQPSATAIGDGADEDGVVFNTPLTPGAVAQVTVTASKVGYLNAWIDFNSNGSFDPGEQIASDLELAAGANAIEFIVPATATGAMAARFRFTCDDPDGALGSTGAWGNGEVEDYVLGSIGDKVWLDNGDGGGVGGDGIQNGTEGGVEGVVVYLLDGDGDRVTDANGDEIFATTDRDGCYEFSGLPAGTYAVEFELPADHDFTLPNVGDEDSDSDADPLTGETAAVVVGAGDVNNDLDAGLVQYDFGDLPDGYGTTRAADGAVHLLDTSTYLGSSIDVEANGQPNDSATGDGTDEDGVVFNTPLMPGDNASITVTASKIGYLNAWIDFNSNGTFDAGEQIAADLELAAGANNITFAVPVDATGTMAARFRFTCDDPDGALGSTGSWDNGEVEDYILGSIGDKVWLDNGVGGGVGADGIRNGAEPAVAGIVVNLLNEDGTPVLDADGDAITTTTDDDGCYEFPGLPVGEYRVEFELPTGYQFTDQNIGDDTTDSDADEATGVSEPIEINAGTDDTTVDAGLQEQDFGDLPDTFGTITAEDGARHGIDGQTYLGAGVDAETDGQPSAEAEGDGTDEDGVEFNTPFVPGTIASVTVTASKAGFLNAWIDFDADGVFSGDDQIMSDVAVSAGANVISFAIPSDADMTNLNARFRFTCDDPDGDLGPTGAWDNGEVEDYHEPLGAIGDFVWFDRDGDAYYDADDEVGYPGVQVTLTGDVDGDGVDEVVTTTTDEDGRYRFDGLPFIEWDVAITPPAGTMHTYDADGGLDGTSTIEIDEIDRVDLDQDFGLKGTGSIGDTIFLDTNSDGVQDPGEIALPGVPVSLGVDLDGDGDIDQTIETETGPDGTYLFENLPAGDYVVTMTPVWGLTPTTDHDGDDTPDASSEVPLGIGEENLDQDFGLIGPGSIGDKVFIDDDKDDEFDDGEGAETVTVTLTADLNDDGILERWTTETNANGDYLFSGLPVTPDGVDYTVTVDTSTLPPDSVWNTVDPDGDRPSMSEVTLTDVANSDLEQDFGYVEVDHALLVSEKEQLMLEIVNLARQDPAAAAALFGIDLNDGLAAGTISADPKQPLAPAALLSEAAAIRAAELIATDLFAADESGARVAAGISSLADLATLTGGDLLSFGISPFGSAGAFNVFVFGDMTSTNTDAAGRVAVGGDATLTNFGVASGLLNPVAQQYSLMVGGALDHTGMVFQGDTVTGADVPIDFAEMADSLRTVSTELSALPDTHSTEVTESNGIFMDATGSDGGLNVFTVDAADLADAVQFDIDADEGETVIVNVIGDSVDVSNFQMRVNGQNLQQGGTAPFQLLFNIPTATTMSSTGFSWQGHVLAPNADYQFDNGHINGQLIVNNLSGTGEFHDFYFDGVMPATLPHYCPTDDVHALMFQNAERRMQLLDADSNEAGIAFEYGTYERFGTEFDSALGLEVIDQTSDMYITGVMFNDSVSENNFYDIGEGLAHPTITAIAEDGTEYVGATAVSGGFAILVPPGRYTIVAGHGGEEWSATGVEVTDKNVKLDFNTAAGAYTELRFSLEAPYVSERETMIGRVTRSGTDIESPYTVSLSASADLGVPDSVVIPAGETSATFAITGTDDDELEGTELATVRLNGAASVESTWDVPIRELQRLIPSDADGGDNTGHAIAIDGDIAVVGARFADVDGVRQSGAVYIYQRTVANKWTEVAKIVAPDSGLGDRAGGDRFGSAVAVQGDTLIVGAPLEEALGEAKNSGAVYVFKRDEGGADNWGLAQRVSSADSRLGDQFGSSVAIDGETVVIGARIADGATKKNTGAVYVFDKEGDSYAQAAVLNDAESLRNDQFGYVVDISGNHIIVGAPFTDADTGADSGTAYVYEKRDGDWELARKIEAPDREGDVSGGDQFANAVAIDGDIAVVGAYAEEEGRADLSSGAAYVFSKTTDDGGPWGQMAKLRSDDIAKRDHFGFAVDVDGNRIVVGSRLKNSDEGVVKTGAAYIFEREGETDTWTQIDKLEAFDSKEKDYAGSAVALSGQYAAVGAQFSNLLGGNSGTAYVFYSKAKASKKPLLASAPVGSSRFGLKSLTTEDLKPIVAAAVDQWRNTPLTASQMETLDSFSISVADLAGLRLGEANPFGITIDHDAAGYGWYIDETPHDLTDDAIGSRMDLLTVVLHEVGHVLGLEDTYDASRSNEIMYGHLSESERRSVFTDLGGLLTELEAM